MLSRALTAKPRKISTIFKYGSKSTFGWSKSVSVSEYDDFSTAVGFMEDQPLVHCGPNHHGKIIMKQYSSSSCGDHDTGWTHGQLMLNEVLRASVAVLGDQSRLGMSEKVVLSGGKICVLKRFRKLSVGKSEFGKRLERFFQVSVKSKNNLVPVMAYLYAKRIKFVLCDYYPMGSLADLLAGSRQHGHTALDWNQRLTIVLHIAQAIAFIHAISPAQEKNMQMNVHGNIKASNVMINTDFSACLSDYGIAQVAERVEVFNAWQWKPGSPTDVYYSDALCQKCDEEKEKKQAWQVLDIALACTNKQPEARPTIEQIRLHLGDVCNNDA
ncbi:putative inactive receptor kinase [Morus notabilis]|uniref:Putative inactive receptor kinase n=1 Tax=Morus notabilis TaxID=981085 RepID=W9RAY8_9ROSA|nr:putative inactive receptor kinase [Morus notabilis]